MLEDIEKHLEAYEDSVNKSIDFLKGEFLLVRMGRANPKLLDKVVVDYYGTLTPITQMANITMPEARIMLVSVWDVSKVKDVTKAIDAANLGVSISDDGKIIRLIFPQLTEERRKEVVKEISRLTENAKVSCRNSRRDVLDVFKKMKKDNQLAEDELERLEKQVQKSLDTAIENIDNMLASKQKEVMEI